MVNYQGKRVKRVRRRIVILKKMVIIKKVKRLNERDIECMGKWNNFY